LSKSVPRRAGKGWDFFFLVDIVGQHVCMLPLKSVTKSDVRKGGKYLDTKGRIGIFDGKELKCEHS